ncbi:MAG: adenosylcobinamide-GDP ribazoletransferase [Chloroflexi bacterium]|nr:adenosylcobinamide-GDP ribazoletransferase [Chloroflexota bacterium]
MAAGSPAWHDPLIALEFLTMLRVRRVRRWSDARFGAALAWFPAVGVLLGAALWGLDRALTGLLPAAAVAALLLAALALATGGLHLDGVADTADGLAAQRSREARLRLMREGTTGPAGVMALVLLLLAQWSALASLEGAARPAALLLAPSLARWAVLPAAAACRPARSSGLGHAAGAALWPFAAPLATATAAAAAVVLFGAQGLVLLALAAVTALATAGAATRTLGGITGDTHGAVVEVTQAAVWLAILAGADGGWLVAAELP